MDYTPHHTAISVRDLDISLRFYTVFGFQQVHRYDDEDKTGVKLKLKDYVLEIFIYKTNQVATPLNLSVGNNLPEIGVKHFAFSVGDVDLALQELRALGLADQQTEILTKGAARFFFIKDPDGIWVEIIKDDRY